MSEFLLTYILPGCIYLYLIVSYVAYKEKENKKISFK